MEQQKKEALDALIASEYANTAGVVVLKDGARVYENYFNGCDSGSAIHVYSVTKSIVSILIGIAIDKGYIKSLDQNVLEFFPDYQIQQGETMLRKISLKDLITMTAPYKYQDCPSMYESYFTCDDRLEFTLDLLGGKQAIGRFRYTPIIGPDILTGVIASATGGTVLEFSSENLFNPLGITVQRNIVLNNEQEHEAFNMTQSSSGWVVDQQGLNSGGWGLSLSAADMAKIGQLYLNGGMWDGKPIVSEKWIEESTKIHSRWESEGLLYGYLWWIIDETERSFAAMGDGGNIIYVNRAKNTVISIAAFFMENARDRIKLIKGHIEPVLNQLDRG